MKLSELVGYLNLVNSIDLDLECQLAMNKFQGIEHTISNHKLQIGGFKDDFAHTLKNMSSSFADTQQTFGNLKNAIRGLIAELEPEYYQNSQSLYDGEKRHYHNEHLLNRRLEIDPDSHKLLQARLLSQVDWRLPGLIIHPGRESFIEHLVALDPLYLVDQHQDLLDPAMQLFPDIYQRRLRPYVINDYDNQDVLWQLPSNQFGFVFAYNYFNYKPIKVLRQYLDSIHNKLRPGGTVLFTFNDCDFAYGIGLAEANVMCYTPAKEIQVYAKSIGFEIVSNHQGQLGLSWMELRKPGKIQSIRGGQAVAKIVAN